MRSQAAGSQQRGSNLIDSLNLLQGTGATTQLLQGTSTVTMPGRSAAQVDKGSGGPPGGTTRLLDDSAALAFAASVLEPEPASGMGLMLESEPAGKLQTRLSEQVACMAGEPHSARVGTSSTISWTALVLVIWSTYLFLNTMAFVAG